MDNALAFTPFARSLAAEGRPLDAFHLAQGVCARVCHDIAGPLGALGGILDQALDGGDEEARTLAAELVGVLGARLRLLRSAWGGDGETPTGPDLHTMLPGLPGARHLRLDTAGLGLDTPETLRRAAPALLLLAASSLPRGGLVALSCGEGDGALRLLIEGPGAGWPRALAACAAWEEPASHSSPRGIAIPLACFAAREAGATLTIDSPTRLTLHPH